MAPTSAGSSHGRFAGTRAAGAGAGCTRTNLVHWVDGGRTDPDNLFLVCSAHHHHLHEGGVKVGGDPAGELCFVTPYGRHLTSRPRMCAPATR